jgi:hypothetical protein
MSEILPLAAHPLVRWLGGLGRWLVVEPAGVDGRGRPMASVRADWGLIGRASGADQFVSQLAFVRGAAADPDKANSLQFIEAAGRLLADGPKLFAPTIDQFEAMAGVDCRLSIADVKLPFPALVVRVPEAWRARRAAAPDAAGGHVPRYAVVRSALSPSGVPGLVVAVMFPGYERVYAMHDQPGNPDVETVLRRFVGTAPDAQDAVRAANTTLAFEVARAAVNLSILLTHAGAVLGPEPDRRGRRSPKAARFVAGEFQAVSLPAEVVVRFNSTYAPRRDAPEGDNTDGPHHLRWRRGHWRSRPGEGGQAGRRRGGQARVRAVAPVAVPRRRPRGRRDCLPDCVTLSERGPGRVDSVAACGMVECPGECSPATLREVRHVDQGPRASLSPRRQLL